MADFFRWVLVEEYVHSGGDIQNYDFATTLNGDLDEEYLVQIYIISGAASVTVNLRINAATMVGDANKLQNAGSTVTGSSPTSSSAIGTYTTAERYFGTVHIPFSMTSSDIDRVAYVQFVSGIPATSGSPAIIGMEAFHITTPASTVNITSLGVGTDVASSIAAGSVLQLYKRGR